MPSTCTVNAGLSLSLTLQLANLAKTLKAGEVSKLTVNGFDLSKMADLKAGLTGFKSFLAPGATVEIWSLVQIPDAELAALGRQVNATVRNVVTPSSGIGGLGLFGLPGMTGTSAQFQQDAQNAQAIMTQIQQDAQKQQMERWKIIQDTQTKIFEIQQDVTVNKAKSSDKAYQRWNEYIRG